jgi:hypothetical protein
VRNLYREAPGHEASARTIAHYVGEARKALANAALSDGEAVFGPLPHAAETTT